METTPRRPIFSGERSGRIASRGHWARAAWASCTARATSGWAGTSRWKPPPRHHRNPRHTPSPPTPHTDRPTQRNTPPNTDGPPPPSDRQLKPPLISSATRHPPPPSPTPTRVPRSAQWSDRSGSSRAAGSRGPGARDPQPSEHRGDLRARRERPRCGPWCWSSWKAGRCPGIAAGSAPAGGSAWRSRGRSPARWPPRTREGIVHRDLKPGNIMWCDGERKVRP